MLYETPKLPDIWPSICTSPSVSSPAIRPLRCISEPSGNPNDMVDATPRRDVLIEDPLFGPNSLVRRHYSGVAKRCIRTTTYVDFLALLQ